MLLLGLGLLALQGVGLTLERRSLGPELVPPSGEAIRLSPEGVGLGLQGVCLRLETRSPAR